MKKIISLALMLALVCTFALSPASSVEGTEKKLPSGLSYGDLPAAIEGYVRDHEESTCGLNVLVYDREGTIYENAFGYADKEKSLPLMRTRCTNGDPSPNLWFGSASCNWSKKGKSI